MRGFMVLALAMFSGCSLVVSLDDLVRDGDGSTDAAPDVAPDVLVTGRFCDSIDADICEDMDDDAALARWYTPDAGVTIESTTASSAPNALHVAIASDASCVDFDESLPILPNAIDRATFDVDVFMDPSTSAYAHALTLRFTDPNDVLVGCLVMVGSGPTSDGLYVQAYNHGVFTELTTRAVTILPPSPVGRWRHVSVQADFSIDLLSWNVDHSSDTSFGPVPLGSSACKGLGLAEVRLGTHCANQPTFSNRYDNVVINHH